MTCANLTVAASHCGRSKSSLSDRFEGNTEKDASITYHGFTVRRRKASAHPQALSGANERAKKWKFRYAAEGETS